MSGLQAMTRVREPFGALVLVQSAHSTEEYFGRLWESFPPARWVTGLVAQDLERGFLVLNVVLVTFGVWCLVWPIRRRWPSAAWLAWGWAVLETLNGTVHLLWSLRQGGYTPGVATAPILLVLGVVLARRLRDASATLSCPS